MDQSPPGPAQSYAGRSSEALHERYLGNYEDKFSDMANEVAAINAELKLRDLACVSTEFLLYRKACLQARMERDYETTKTFLSPNR